MVDKLVVVVSVDVERAPACKLPGRDERLALAGKWRRSRHSTF